MPICWPIFPQCYRFRILGPTEVDALLWGYLALALAALLLFTRRWTVGAGYVALIILELVKIAIIVQDYRLRLNQHYMAFFVVLAFLLFPAKRRVLQYLIVLFYFWAGTLKLNREWLTGAALYRQEFLWLPQVLIPAACAYVVVLETILSFGLLARRAWIFWATLGQLALFHAMSWPIVGSFYPSLMFAASLRSSRSPVSGRWGPTGRASRASSEGSSSGRRTCSWRRSRYSSWCRMPSRATRRSLGEGRSFALHMFDARVACEAHLTLHDAQGGTQLVQITTDRGPVRSRCDPLVHFNVARAFCREGAASGGWTDLDLFLESRRATEPTLRPVIQIERFCAAKPSYDVWRPNPWIRRE